MQAKYSRGVLFCVIATMSWGGMFPVMTHALRHIDPFTFTCMRYVIAGLAFLAVLLWREGREGLRVPRDRIALAWLFGTAGFAGFQFLVFLGQRLAGPQGALTASIMMATQPMLGFVVNWVIRRLAPPKFVIGFILMSFLGITLVITKGHPGTLLQHPSSYGPDALIVLGALCWVIYTVGAAFFPSWSPYKYTTITTGLGLTSTFAVTAALVATGAVALPGSAAVGSVAPELAYMGLVAGFVGVLSWNLGNKILTPLNGVLFMDIVPVTAFTISALEGVVPTSVQIVGACVTATALILNNVFLRHRMAARVPAASAAGRAEVPAAGQAGVAPGVAAVAVPVEVTGRAR